MKKIILVEDDEIVARMYEKVFSLGGFQVATASDGREGLDKIKQIFTPTWFILDVMMPKNERPGGFAWIEAKSVYKDYSVVMLTNLNLPEEVRLALESGAAVIWLSAITSQKKYLK